jgi:hypothetical protein
MGQKAQQPERIGTPIGQVKNDMTDEIETVAKDGFQRALNRFFTGIGFCSARTWPVR